MKQEKPRDETARIRSLIEIDRSTLPPDGGPSFNRLIFTKSPYLLQHADNPVDWRPWGEEAFDEARRAGKPVLVSIGYSTCHWCHVMEEEVFADREAAELINSNLIAVKVDREERPDIDSQYMRVAQMMTGSGGWPLKIIMTPEKKPFYAATYLPKMSRPGIQGIMELIPKVSNLWQTNRSLIEKSGDSIVEALQMRHAAKKVTADYTVVDRAYRDLSKLFDNRFGGFGDAPKFPMPLYISFLVRRNEPKALEMAAESLRAMHAGGIYDQVGFGFHRYAVDRQWLVPHFEKMLYDQALLALAYIEAHQATGDRYFLGVAEDIFEFVLRDLTSPDGGFYSGLDADSEGEEGKYYLWTPAEVAAILGTGLGAEFCRMFGITTPGNFEGRNIPHLERPLHEVPGDGRDDLFDRLEKGRLLLLAAREKRIRPFRDEKVLTGWNGLMIAAMAKGYALTGAPALLSAAEQAVEFIMKRLRTPTGRLLRSYHLGEASVRGFLEDYSFFAWGLLELYEATADTDHLGSALSVTRDMTALFEDRDGGGFFDSGADAEHVIARLKSSHDDVIPSGNSVAAMNLLRLGRIMPDDTLLREANKLFSVFMEDVGRFPSAYPYMLLSLARSATPKVEVTIVRCGTPSEMSAMLRTINRRMLPNLVLKVAEKNDTAFKVIDGAPTAYVCAAGACRPPAAGATELALILDEIG